MPHSSPRQHVCQEDGDQQRETQAKNQSPPRPCGEAGKAGLATSPRTRWANISDLQLIFTVMGIGLVLGN